MGKTHEITEFLKEFKNNLSKKFTFVTRKDNVDTLTRFGLKVRHAKYIISQLTYKDYFNGPKKDRDIKGNMIWEFGVDINNEEIYIKLSDDFSGGLAKCISFHLANRPIKYPYKPSKKRK